MTGDPKIRFVRDGKTYEVGMEAYDTGALIVLPDGTLLRAGGWFETFPPMPAGLEVVPTVKAEEV
jgi:hypothetical protein